MPITSKWDDVRDIWVLTSGELLELDELTDLIAQTDWQRGRRELWDMRAMIQGPSATREIVQAAGIARDGPAPRHGRRSAIVVGRDFDYAIARMFQAFAGGSGIQYAIFRDVDEALAWLADGETNPT
jgi:hypothetical protein